MNKTILDEIKNQDYQTITKIFEDFLKSQVSKSNAKGLIFGLSGGIDSAVIAYLCARVFKNNSLAIVLPDSKITPKIDTDDAIKMAEILGINYKLLDINSIFSEYEKHLEYDEKSFGNLRARIRANLLYYYANLKNYLVVGSSDKSEYLIGYFTKFGDGSADVLPIVSLYKSQVRELAKFLGIEDSIISKKSSPQLWTGHIAEEEIGVTYEEIDSILYCVFDKKLTIEETVKTTQIEKKVVDKIYQLYKNSQHKRITASKP